MGDNGVLWKFPHIFFFFVFVCEVPTHYTLTLISEKRNSMGSCGSSHSGAVHSTSALLTSKGLGGRVGPKRNA